MAKDVNSTPVATQVFGVAVNLILRNAMQRALITRGLLPNGCVVGSESEACMPSLTREQLATIFANIGFTDWSNLRLDNVDPNAVLLPNSATDSGNTNIHICGYAAGPGIWATVNIKFENAPCFGGSEAYINPSTQASTAGANSPHAETSASSGAQKIMHAMSRNVDVESCLVGLNNGTATGTFNPYPQVLNDSVNLPATSNGRWAIGVLSVDRNAVAQLPYRFIKIGGFSPSSHNVVEGKYEFWSQLASLTGPGLPLVNEVLAFRLLQTISDPVIIAKMQVTQTWGGIAGFLGDATASPFNFNSPAFDPLRPVNIYSHQKAGVRAGLDHCRIPTIPSGIGLSMPVFY